MIRVLSREPDRSMLGLSHVSMARSVQYREIRGFALLERGGKGGDPAGVALEGATEYELLGHDCV
jgi:hypothetical protein